MDDWSEPHLRLALSGAALDLGDRQISLEREPDLSRPTWAFSRAMVGRVAFAKFAFSHETAVRIWHEAQALRMLGAELDMRVPKLVAASRDPACLATQFISGTEPLAYATVAAADPERIDKLASELAEFLSRLHAPETLSLARQRLDRLAAPGTSLEVSTDRLRTRFMSTIEPHLRSTVHRWCDWIDAQLTPPAETVLVHGDFHPYNQLWDRATPRLVAVTDFESLGLAEPEFDFRVLPVFGPGVELLLSTAARYEALSGRRLDLARVMAWHLLNYLGDALWRTEAGIELPDPGDTASDYVEEAAGRLAALGINA